MGSGSAQLRPLKVRPVRSNLCGSFAAALLAIAVAGCDITKQPDPPPAVDPNLYPQNYRKQIAIYLSQELMDRADFRGARISPPMLKQVGDTAHYVVCVQFGGHGEIKNKVVIYLAGEVNQFVDSTSDQCGAAAYQPFTELEQTIPDK
jgi:hypothetical protein